MYSQHPPKLHRLVRFSIQQGSFKPEHRPKEMSFSQSEFWKYKAQNVVKSSLSLPEK